MRNHGLTLPELLSTLAIASILMCLASPLGSLLTRERILTSVTQLANSLRYARTYAVSQHTGVTVRAIDDSWSLGWRIFTDPNRNSQLDPSETLLLSRETNASLLVRGNRPVANYVHFDMSGEPELTSGGFQAGALTFCSATSPEDTFQLILGKSGRVRIEQKTADQTCK